jgi:MATE family multidrug resistance protein
MTPHMSASHPWRTEFRAMLVLSWPLILSNLTMALIQATDVVLMGWLGPHALAASALGLNLTFAFLLFGIGMITASSPMMATALGRRAHSVRQVRRTFRQALWLAALLSLGIWLVLWNAEPLILGLGQEPSLAHDAGRFLRGYMWSALPFLLFQVMRNFLSALERPGWILAISAVGIGLNALLGWALIFGHFGPRWALSAAEWRPVSSGRCSLWRWRPCCSPTASSRASICSGGGGDRTGRASGHWSNWGCRSGCR